MKILKIARILLITLVCILMIGSVAYGYNYTGLINTLDGSAGNATLNSKAQTIVGAIISVTRIIATGVAIIMLLVLAMKYMMAAPGERAEIKKHAVVYIVGALVLFSTAGILRIIQNFAGNI